MERMFSYRLQFFAESNSGEKTEEASTKKLTDARQEGQVAKSQDLITAASLLTLFVILKVYVSFIGTNLLESFSTFYGVIAKYSKDEFTLNSMQQLMKEAIFLLGKTVIPIFLSAVFVGFTLNILQVKWVITAKPLMPKLSKFNPISGFKKMFSADKWVELIKEVIKIIFIVYLAINTINKNMDMLVKLYDMELDQSVFLIGNMVVSLGMNISIIFLLIGLADYIYQRLKFKKDMKMSKQEVRDEYKQSEGDPQIKSKIKAKMREASQRRMMQRLPEADVVITNPTHFAAAIKYDKEKSEAPILIAKGADYLAFKIKEVAKENNIEIVENKPLARMLYYNVEVEQEIPPELYQMTAEVLAYVYNLKNKV